MSLVLRILLLHRRRLHRLHRRSRQRLKPYTPCLVIQRQKGRNCKMKSIWLWRLSSRRSRNRAISLLRGSTAWKRSERRRKKNRHQHEIVDPSTKKRGAVLSNTQSLIRRRTWKGRLFPGDSIANWRRHNAKWVNSQLRRWSTPPSLRGTNNGRLQVKAARTFPRRRRRRPLLRWYQLTSTRTPCHRRSLWFRIENRAKSTKRLPCRRRRRRRRSSPLSRRWASRVLVAGRWRIERAVADPRESGWIGSIWWRLYVAVRNCVRSISLPLAVRRRRSDRLGLVRSM